jgi:hypothetical protein
MAEFLDSIHCTTATAPGTGAFVVSGADATTFRVPGAADNGKTFLATIYESTVGTETCLTVYTHAGTSFSRGALQSGSTRLTFGVGARLMLTVSADVMTGLDQLWASLGGDPISVTTTTTATIGRMHVCTGTSADYTVTLPAAAGNAGRFIGFRMAPALTRLVTIDGNASETINGALTRVMWANESALLSCDGVGWFKVAGLTVPLSAGLFLPSNQTLVAATVTIVDCTSVDFDASTRMADTTNKRINIRRTGNYLVSGVCRYNGPGVVDRCITVAFKNAIQFLAAEGPSAAGSSPGPFMAAPETCVSGDYIDLRAFQGTGTAGLFGSSDKQTKFSVTEIPAW